MPDDFFYPERHQEERRKALRNFAQHHNLHFVLHVDKSRLDPAFFVFSLGRREVLGNAQNLVEGMWKGIFLREFDYEVSSLAIYPPGPPGLLTRYAGWRLGYSVVAMEVKEVLPSVLIQHRDAYRRVKEEIKHLLHLHVGKTVEIGDRHFDREIELRSIDPSGARAILTPAVLDVALRTGGVSYEMSSSTVLAYRELQETEGLPSLLDGAASFREALEAQGRPAR